MLFKSFGEIRIYRRLAQPSFHPSSTARRSNSVNSLNLNDFPFYGSRAIVPRHMAERWGKKRDRQTTFGLGRHETARRSPSGRNFCIRRLSMASISIGTTRRGTKRGGGWTRRSFGSLLPEWLPLFPPPPFAPIKRGEEM